MKKNITVGIDIRDLKIAVTGTKTFLEGICNEFNKKNPGFTFYFFTTNTSVYTGKNIFLKTVEHFRYLIWKQVILPSKARIAKCDIVFCSDFFVPYFHPGFVTIPVFHDAFFWEYPEHYNKYWLWLFRKIGVAAARRSAYIITPTEFTRKRIAYFSGIDSARIIPVYEAAKKFSPISDNNAQTENPVLQKIFSSQYILHVGTFEKRKNIPRLIKAFKLLKDGGYENIKLLLVGQASKKAALDDTTAIQKSITETGLQDQVFMPGYVSDKDLSLCYQNAFFYTLPSLNEGFGIPVLEAFQHKIPVLIANNSCLIEVAGDAAISFDPFNEHDIADKMKLLMDNPALHQEMIEKGSKRLELFSWEKTSIALLSVFQKVVKKK